MNQIQINTQAQGYSPLEVEQRITFPIETVLTGIPKLDYTLNLQVSFSRLFIEHNVCANAVGAHSP